jgi:DNA topoisomerase-2
MAFQRFVASGEISMIDGMLEITELPIKMWTQTYKEILTVMLEGTNDKPQMISDFKEYHTDETVRFEVRLAQDKLRQYEREGLHKVFKLQAVINTSSMVLFDADGCLRRYNTPEEICKEFFETRKSLYVTRKAFLDGMLNAQSDQLSEKARFIMMKINNQIQIENKRKTAIVEQLIEKGFKPDPVKVWHEEQKKKELEKSGDVAIDEEEEESENVEVGIGGFFVQFFDLRG